MTIRVLIVDDSRVTRAMLMRLLSIDSAIEVVGVAENGNVALERLVEVTPDLVLLDIEMPQMDGIAFLRELRRRKNFTPVLVFSSLSQRGALVTVEALASGASDYVTKPSGVTAAGELPRELRSVLLEKIHALGARSARVRQNDQVKIEPPPKLVAPAPKASRIDCVAIGVSTGGPQALNDILREISAELPVPIVIVQHMPRLFTEQLARTLGNKCTLKVSEAKHNEPLERGHVFIAPGGQHMRIRRDALGQPRVSLSDEPPVRSCRPSVDLLFESVSTAYGPNALGVILTGMGNDGLAGAQAIRSMGGEMLAQDEPTSVVWGMPGEVVKAGLASRVVPLPMVAIEITRRVGSRK